jgi:hypothetical protein
MSQKFRARKPKPFISRTRDSYKYPDEKLGNCRRSINRARDIGATKWQVKQSLTIKPIFVPLLAFKAMDEQATKQAKEKSGGLVDYLRSKIIAKAGSLKQVAQWQAYCSRL